MAAGAGEPFGSDRTVARWLADQLWYRLRQPAGVPSVATTSTLRTCITVPMSPGLSQRWKHLFRSLRQELRSVIIAAVGYRKCRFRFRWRK